MDGTAAFHYKDTIPNGVQVASVDIMKERPSSLKRQHGEIEHYSQNESSGRLPKHQKHLSETQEKEQGYSQVSKSDEYDSSIQRNHSQNLQSVAVTSLSGEQLVQKVSNMAVGLGGDTQENRNLAGTLLLSCQSGILQAVQISANHSQHIDTIAQKDENHAKEMEHMRSQLKLAQRELEIKDLQMKHLQMKHKVEHAQEKLQVAQRQLEQKDLQIKREAEQAQEERTLGQRNLIKKDLEMKREAEHVREEQERDRQEHERIQTTTSFKRDGK